MPACTSKLFTHSIYFSPQLLFFIFYFRETSYNFYVQAEAVSRDRQE